MVFKISFGDVSKEQAEKSLRELLDSYKDIDTSYFIRKERSEKIKKIYEKNKKY